MIACAARPAVDMHVQFVATSAGSSTDEYAIIAALAGSAQDGGHYVTFQRSSEQEGDDEDWGVYIEFDDQAHGGYDRIGRCVVSRQQVEIALSRALPNLDDVTGFSIQLAITDHQYAEFVAGVRMIFRGAAEALLHIA